LKKTPKSVYFWEFSQRYLTEVCDLHKPATYQNYKSILARLDERFGGQRLDEIDRQDIQRYFTELARKMAPKSAAQHWIVLGGLLRYAESEGLHGEVRKPRLPKARRKPQPWWSLAEMRKLIEGTVGPMKILVMVLAETGCRIGEALALQTKHVDFERKQLHIHQGWSAGVLSTPKSEASYRTLALSDKLCETLSAFCVGQPDAFIFRNRSGRHWAAGVTRYQFSRACNRLKLDARGFHAFRRGNITMCIRDLRLPLEVVAGRVGHETGIFTMDVYVQKMDDYDADYIGKIAEKLYGGRDGDLREMQQGHSQISTPGREEPETDDPAPELQAGQTFPAGAVSLPG